MRGCILFLLAVALGGCTTLRVATPEEAAALDDVDWQVERAPTELEASPGPGGGAR